MRCDRMCCKSDLVASEAILLLILPSKVTNFSSNSSSNFVSNFSSSFFSTTSPISLRSKRVRVIEYNLLHPRKHVNRYWGNFRQKYYKCNYNRRDCKNQNRTS